MLYSEDGELMPLTFADPGVENIIKKIGGNSEVRAHLETWVLLLAAQLLLFLQWRVTLLLM